MVVAAYASGSAVPVVDIAKSAAPVGTWGPALVNNWGPWGGHLGVAPLGLGLPWGGLTVGAPWGAPHINLATTGGLALGHLSVPVAHGHGHEG